MIMAIIILALLVSCMAVSAIVAYWHAKAFFLGAQPVNINIFYKIIAGLSLAIASLLMTPFGLLAAIPGLVIGGTIGAINSLDMDDDHRKRFLRDNTYKYIQPHRELTSGK